MAIYIGLVAYQSRRLSCVAEEKRLQIECVVCVCGAHRYASEFTVCSFACGRQAENEISIEEDKGRSGSSGFAGSPITASNNNNKVFYKYNQMIVEHVNILSRVGRWPGGWNRRNR